MRKKRELWDPYPCHHRQPRAEGQGWHMPPSRSRRVQIGAHHPHARSAQVQLNEELTAFRCAGNDSIKIAATACLSNWETTIRLNTHRTPNWSSCSRVKSYPNSFRHV